MSRSGAGQASCNLYVCWDCTTIPIQESELEGLLIDLKILLYSYIQQFSILAYIFQYSNLDYEIAFCDITFLSNLSGTRN